MLTISIISNILLFVKNNIHIKMFEMSGGCGNVETWKGVAALALWRGTEATRMMWHASYTYDVARMLHV
jgi:hypothetical protein